jgi:pilus assembly protein Flp/PilA
MTKLYVKASEAVHGLRTDKKGVVSFEYIIVAACIVAVVIAVFKTDNSIKTALTTGIATISTAMLGL